jgi:uncharacterized membrane protein
MIIDFWKSLQGAYRYCTRGFAHRWESRTFVAVMGLLAFLFPFSLLFVVGGLLPPGYGVVSSVMLILAGVANLLVDIRAAGRPTAVLRILSIAGVLFVVELGGVRTGFPFGE